MWGPHERLQNGDTGSGKFLYPQLSAVHGEHLVCSLGERERERMCRSGEERKKRDK